MTSGLPWEVTIAIGVFVGMSVWSGCAAALLVWLERLRERRR